MRISIVTTVYNKENTIKETIDSILSQTEKDLELIVVNDGSTDNSESRILEVKDKRISYFKFDVNKGCGSAFRFGVSKCNGKYVGVVDGGDVISSNAVSIMADIMDSDFNISLVYSDYVRIKAHLNSSINTGKRVIKGSYLGGLLGKCPKTSIIHFKMFRKSLYDSTVGVKEGLRKSVDKELILLMEEVGKLVYVPYNLYYWRKEPLGITRSFNHLPPEMKSKLEEDMKDVINRALERRKK